DGFSGSLKIKSSDNVKFTVFEGSFIKPVEYRFGENISSPLGTFALLRTSKGTMADLEILCTPALQLANRLVSRIQIVPGKENSSKFVDISLVDPVKERAALIINTLIEVYNSEMIEDGNKIAVSTSDFISKRLQIIAGDLQGVDKELAGYKSQNNINLSVEEAGMYMAESSAADREVITISTKLQVAQQLVSTLKNNKYVLMPSSVSIQETDLNSAIDSYNRVVLERQEYARTMGESNPVLQSLNKSLTDLKENIQNSLALYQNSLQIALRAAELEKSRSESHLDKAPSQELSFRNIVRQQQIVEAVYLTLLQQREEAEIRSSASGDAVKVVDYAFVSPSPVTPNPLQI